LAIASDIGVHVVLCVALHTWDKDRILTAGSYDNGHVVDMGGPRRATLCLGRRRAEDSASLFKPTANPSLTVCLGTFLVLAP